MARNIKRQTMSLLCFGFILSCPDARSFASENYLNEEQLPGSNFEPTSESTLSPERTPGKILVPSMVDHLDYSQHKGAASPWKSRPTLPAPGPESTSESAVENSDTRGISVTTAALSKHIVDTNPSANSVSERLSELRLSNDQTKEIIKIRQIMHPEAEQRLKDEYTQLRQSLSQAMAANSSGQEVRQHFEAMQIKYQALQKIKFEKLLKIREVLTPEQRKKFAELKVRPVANKD